MGIDEALDRISREGFLKVSSQKREGIPDSQKTALNRKANALFNSGQFEQAKRIFLTTGYSDGIIRMGDHYYEQNDHLEALRMYWMAPAPDKVERMMETITAIVQEWLGEDEQL